MAAEPVAGTPSARRDEIWGRVRGLPWVDLDAEAQRAVGDAYAALRARGKQVPLTDRAIAIAAVRAAAPLWTFDDDVARMEEVVSGLRRFEPA